MASNGIAYLDDLNDTKELESALDDLQVTDDNIADYSYEYDENILNDTKKLDNYNQSSLSIKQQIKKKKKRN